MFKAKFIHGLPLAQPDILKLAVSMRNERQTGEALAAFIDLANRHKNRIKHLEIILSDYLQRFYVGEKNALELGDNWLTQNQQYLNKLEIPYTICRWKEILETEQYQEAQKRIENFYKENDKYQMIVNNVAKQHINKADLEAAKKFLLEECTVFKILKGNISYPSKNLNEAIKYVVQHFKCLIQYIAYRVDPIKLNNKKDINFDVALMNACLLSSQLMENHGISEIEEQTTFFKLFVEMKTQFLLAKKDKKSLAIIA